MKKALLIVSFGTSHKETRDKTIGEIEKFISEAYPDRELRRAFTSGMIMKVLRNRDNISIDNVQEAMERLKQEGFEDILVQPTHIINGEEYDKMISQIEPYEENFKSVNIGTPLLTTSDDYEAVCKAIIDEVEELDVTKHKDVQNEVALVLMGHGTGHFADAAYAALDYRFKALGYENVFVGTVEGYPEVELVVENVKKYNYKKVVLMPFMVVAGDHAVNDMAGDEEDSWKVIFTKAGFDVECILRGLGEFKGIQQIYLNHIVDCK